MPGGAGFTSQPVGLPSVPSMHWQLQEGKRAPESPGLVPVGSVASRSYSSGPGLPPPPAQEEPWFHQLRDHWDQGVSGQEDELGWRGILELGGQKGLMSSGPGEFPIRQAHHPFPMP